MGRKKVHVTFIENAERRFLTLTKRYDGLAKKANDLARLTNSQVFLVVNYGAGEHIRHFSMTGNFETDILYLQHMMELAKESRGTSCYEMTTKEDFVADQGADKRGNLFLEWKKRKPTSYISTPYLRVNGLKNNTRLAKMMKKARESGDLKFNEDGKMIIPETYIEASQSPKLKPSRKRKSSRGSKPIVEDDDEILEAVGEQPKKRRSKDAPRPDPALPKPDKPQFTFSSTVSTPQVQSISITPDGTLNVSQTDMTITHTNVKIKGLNLQSMADQFGLNVGGAPIFHFSSGLHTKPVPPSPQQPQPSPVYAPPPYPSFPGTRNMLPGVDNDGLLAFLNNQSMSPTPLYERRFLEKQAREQMVGKPVAQSPDYDSLWEGIDYGSFMLN